MKYLSECSIFLLEFFDTGCPQSEFTCGDGSWIPMKHTCDGSLDCDDESDEEDMLCESVVAI